MIKMKKKPTLFLLMLWTFYFAGRAQTVDGLIHLHKVNEFGYVDKVFFLDTIGGDTINMINVIDNNPYADFNLSVRENHKSYGTPVYSISNSTVPTDIELYLLKVDSIQREQMHVLGSRVWAWVHHGNENELLCVVYNMYVQDEGNDDFPAARNSTIQIFSPQGELLNEWRDIGTDVSQLHISENGDYAIVVYGAESPHAMVESRGIRLYNMTSGILLTDIPTDDCYLAGGNDNGIISLRCGAKYFVFNPSEPAIYTKTLSGDELKSLISKNNQGFTIMENGSPVMMSYENQFQRLW